MKKALLALALAATGLPAATVVLTPSTLTPTSGTTFTIDVTLEGNTDEVLGFGLNPTSSLLGRASFQSALLNPIFGADLGLGDPAVAVFAFPGSTDSIVPLVVLTFLAGPQTGAVTVGISTNLSDTNQGLFFLSSDTMDMTSEVEVTVLEASGIPEPGSLSLMALAGAGLVALARRRQA